jgi:hypothetical protein
MCVYVRVCVCDCMLFLKHGLKYYAACLESTRFRTCVYVRIGIRVCMCVYLCDCLFVSSSVPGTNASSYDCQTCLPYFAMLAND